MHEKIYKTTAAVVSIFVVSLFLFPLFWAVLGSLKTPATVYTFELPEKWNFFNYVEALSAGPWAYYFFNSFVIGISAALGQCFFGALAGYSLAKFDFPGKNIIFAVVVGVLTFSIQVVFVPLFVLISSFGWVDTYQGLITPMLVAPFSIFLMRQYILGIPDSLIEVARIDGASEPRIFFTIIMPLIKPVLGVVFILAFTYGYNNLVWPLIVVRSKELQPISLALQQFLGNFSYRPELILAATIAGTLPMFVLFFTFQKYFMQGISLGEEK